MATHHSLILSAIRHLAAPMALLVCAGLCSPSLSLAKGGSYSGGGGGRLEAQLVRAAKLSASAVLMNPDAGDPELYSASRRKSLYYILSGLRAFECGSERLYPLTPQDCDLLFSANDIDIGYRAVEIDGESWVALNGGYLSKSAPSDKETQIKAVHEGLHFVVGEYWSKTEGSPVAKPIPLSLQKQADFDRLHAQFDDLGRKVSDWVNEQEISEQDQGPLFFEQIQRSLETSGSIESSDPGFHKVTQTMSAIHAKSCEFDVKSRTSFFKNRDAGFIVESKTRYAASAIDLSSVTLLEYPRSDKQWAVSFTAYTALGFTVLQSETADFTVSDDGVNIEPSSRSAQRENKKVHAGSLVFNDRKAAVGALKSLRSWVQRCGWTN